MTRRDRIREITLIIEGIRRLLAERPDTLRPEREAALARWRALRAELEAQPPGRTV